MLAIEEHPYVDHLRSLQERYQQPRAIVIFTAHWESRVQKISRVETYDTIYDFYGFPKALYEVTYPATGDPALAAKIHALFAAADIESEFDTERGLDHGSWTVLHHIYPEANIPVVQLSLNPFLSEAEQYAIGKALASLRQENVLIIGSGSTVHGNSEGLPEGWAAQFDDWLGEQLKAWNLNDLFVYAELAPHARVAVPRNEHFVPLILAMGAADDDRLAEELHRSYQFGFLTLNSWEFGHLAK